MTTTKFKIESGVQLLARLSKKLEIESFHPVLFEGGLKQENVVEIISNDSSTSYLLIDIICEALVPTDNCSESVGVFMFNTAGNFNYQEMIKILVNRINFKLNSGPIQENHKTESEAQLLKVLKNFFLVEIYDATQFYTTIHSLDNIFTKHPNIALVLIDTLTAFYWSEQGYGITKMDFYAKNLLGMIQKVSKEYKVILIYTRPAYFSSSKDIKVSELSDITDGINFKLQLNEHSKGVYQVNVKTLESYYQKYFLIQDSILKWQ